MPMRWVTRACWLARGSFSMRVSLVAVWAKLRLGINKTAANKVHSRTLPLAWKRGLCMEISFLLPEWQLDVFGLGGRTGYECDHAGCALRRRAGIEVSKAESAPCPCQDSVWSRIHFPA